MITEIVILAALVAFTALILGLTRRRRARYRYDDPWLVEIESPRSVRIVCSRCGLGLTYISTHRRIRAAALIAEVGRDCSDGHPVKLTKEAA